MCKPGSASGGTSSGLGLAVAVVGIAGVVSLATAYIGTILTAALITVFSLAAAGIVMLVVILRRTRSVVTWPIRTTLPPAAVRRPAPAVARPAIPARQPLAIEAPAPVPVRVGVPTGPGDLAMVAWPPGGAYPDWDGLAVADVIPDRDGVRA
jgi:hypothetical protein